MLEGLSNALKKTTDKIANAIFLDKNLVDSIVKDLQRALIEADVNVSLVLEITKKLKQTALDERISGVEKKEHIIKLLHDELLSILGESREIKLKKQNKIMLVGLYGAGKTTTISKLALYYSKRGHSVCAIGLDVHRPAAPEQLAQVCKKVNIPVFILPEEKNPKQIYKHFEKDLKKYEIVLIDTAGRDALSSDLIKEIKDISKLINPSETLLVMPADIGQSAKTQAQAFKSAVSISGVIITRMDSTAKAGGALTACAEVSSPVLFIGVGEKPSDLEPFNPESFLSRLLGMGDLQALIEKVHSTMNAKSLLAQQEKMAQGELSLEMVIEQAKSLESAGGLSKLKDLIPGMSKFKAPEQDLEKAQGKIKKWEHILKSMTPEEKSNPEILEKQTSRIARIAHGSGTSTSDIRSLIKQYSLLKDLIKSQSSLSSGNMDQKTLMKLAKKFKGKIKF